jgi:hypothetical protein
MSHHSKPTGPDVREVCRPLRGLGTFLVPVSQGSASLHPGLYAAARYRGLVESYNPRRLRG